MIQNLKILLVEDNPGDVRLVQELLSEIKDTEYDLHTTGRLEEALELLKQERFDVCLLDMGLPDSHGLKGLEKIQSRAPAMPVIIRTNLDDEELAVDAVQHGAQDYLVKGTVDARQFSRVIHYAIERQQAQETIRQSEQKISEILSSIKDDFYVLDRDWVFVFANRQFTSKVGKEPEDFIGKRIWDIFPKHKNSVLEDNFRASMEKGEIRRFELGGKYTDAWYSMTSFPSPEGITVLGTDITERKQAQAAIQSYANQLSVLHDVSLSLNRETDFQKLQDMILQKAAEMTRAGVGVLLEKGERGAAVGSVHYADRYDDELAGIEQHSSELWRGVSRLVREQDQYALLIKDLSDFSWLLEENAGLKELLCGLLRDTRGELRGLFLLAGKQEGAEFDASDRDIMALLAAQSSVALTSAENFEREHYVAEILQSSLLPEAPVNGSMDMGLLYRSASQVGRIGGDFYDFVELDDDAIAVAVGDVCGKGLYAANYTAMVKYMLRAFLDEDQEPGPCLTRLNKALAKNISPDKFITMIMAVIRRKEGTMQYALAGHPAPLMNEDGRIEHLEVPGTLPLGVVPGYEYVTVTSDIRKARSILMFTDGLIESRSPQREQFGNERLGEAFAAISDQAAQEQAQSLVDRVLDFTGGNLTDDMAIVVIKPGLGSAG